MKSDLLLDVINYVIEHQLATQKDVDIFKDVMLDTPDNCISVFEYVNAGASWNSEMSTRNVQVVVRDTSGQKAMDLSWKLFHLFKPTEPLSYIGTRHCAVTMKSTPTQIDQDSKRRRKYAFNMSILTTLN